MEINRDAINIEYKVNLQGLEIKAFLAFIYIYKRRYWYKYIESIYVIRGIRI